MTARSMPGLSTRWLGRHWEHHDALPSTNSYCKEQGKNLPHGAAVTASYQTRGRGRLGRRWRDLPDRGLCLSAVLHGWAVEEIGLLPLLTGLAVGEAVEELTGVSAGVKWSNDVLLGDKKLCGILCESRIAGGEASAVLGIGVNLAHTEEELLGLGLVYATSLVLATGRRIPPAEMAAGILNRLEPVLEEYRASGFDRLGDRYRRRCVTLGKPVQVLWEGESRTGVAEGIGPDGALLCRIDGELRAVAAGEASVRGLYGYA